ncbi:UNVERIFIED_CONTAM: hypothetical protein Slati_4195800 [Sesamum latifolium]|uniref:Uncharacterized protein n=1 Tax=Sesamum latifolium TaxID=2727402 RepID=A0AAW2TB10_9LAMI
MQLWSFQGDSNINGEDHLMQLLMGLCDSYDSVRNQILMQEPPPSVNKAYAMILRIKIQKEVSLAPSNISQNMAIQVKGGNFKRPGNAVPFQKKKTVAEKRAQLCDHCGKNERTKEVCFEIYGYPDWYRSLIEQRRRDGANTSRTLNVTNTEEHAQNAVDELTLSAVIRNELHRYMEMQE